MEVLPGEGQVVTGGRRPGAEGRGIWIRKECALLADREKDKQRAFWRTTGVIRRYKGYLLLGFSGVVVSSLCFGAGLGMVLPVMHLLLQEGHRLDELVYRFIGGGPDGRGGFLDRVGDAIAAQVPADPFQAFLMVAGVIGVLTIVGNFGRYVHGIMAIVIAQRSTMIWRSRVLRHQLRLPLGTLMRLGSTDSISRVLNDTTKLMMGFQAILGRAALELGKMLAAFSAAMIINWQLTLAALTVAPLIVLSSGYFGRKIRKATRRVLESVREMLEVARESLTHPRVIKVHSAEGDAAMRFRLANRRMYEQEMSVRQARALISPVNEVLSLTGVLLVAVMAAWFVLRGGTPAEEFLAVMGALIAAGSGVKPLTTLHTDLKEADAGAERILQSLALPTEPIDARSGAKYPKLPRHRASIAFEGVGYRYPGADRPALDNVSLRIEHGRRVAIVGPNGSGKTTLLSLLPRLIEPTTGRVTIDGQDILRVNLRSLREQLAVVTQESVLFSGSLARNIAFGRGWVSRAEIEAAAKAAFADEFIRRLPEGYDAKLGEGGIGLSGGQQQRVCIARAMLRNPAILILDEATSQVDADSEEKINCALRDFSIGRTTLVIAHRLSTVIDSDLIVVMDQGRIVDQGRHEELLERCDVYRVLTQTQLHGPAASPSEQTESAEPSSSHFEA